MKSCLPSVVLIPCAALFACGGSDGNAGPAASDGAIVGRVPTNHRASDTLCTQSAPAGTCLCNGNCPTSTYPSQWACSSDGDCADAGINGRCAASGAIAGCGCTYDICVDDSDCPNGHTCACHGSAYTFGAGNQCVPGNCHVDADCGAGAYCSPSPAMPCNMNGQDLYCQGLGYYCHTPKDQCVDDSDCESVGSPGCLYDPSAGYWKCQVYAQPS